jgi:hypothetical protein
MNQQQARLMNQQQARLMNQQQARLMNQQHLQMRMDLQLSPEIRDVARVVMCMICVRGYKTFPVRLENKSSI